MFDVIIVPVDGSEASCRAISTATLVARTMGTPIQLVSVISPGIDPLETEIELGTLVGEVDAPALAPVVFHCNDVAAALIDALARRRALLCMATHGRGAPGARVLGSTVAALLARTVSPVLLIGPDAQPSAEIRDIVVGVDARSDAIGQVPIVRSWAVSTGARVHLMTVAPDVGSAVDAARLQLSEVSSWYLALGVEASWRVLEGDDAARELNAAATALGAAMLVVGATPAGRRLAWRGLGGLARRVVQHAPCPVLVVPPETMRHAAPTFGGLEPSARDVVLEIGTVDEEHSPEATDWRPLRNRRSRRAT